MSGLLTTAEYTAIAKNLKFQTLAFIDGKFQASVSGKTFQTTNPATGALLAEITACNAQDVDIAVARQSSI
jgi:gamma-glutamyl-gamma-aminobutyraldehyde dehydrogenase